MKILLVNGLLMVAFAVAISLSNAQDTEEGPHNTTASTTTEPTTVTSTTINGTSTTELTTITSGTTETSTASTSKPSPTPTPKPVPPEPPKGIWNVTSESHTCILFDAGIRMTFNYKTTSGKMVTGYRMDVPQDASASGICGPKKQHIELSFNEDWLLTFTFELNETSKKYNVTSVKLEFNEKIFPDAKDTDPHSATNPEPQFPTDVDKQYKCNTHQSVLSKNSTLTGVIDISTFGLQFEAFGNFTKHTFSGGVNHCSADEVSQLVPIIVGAVLAGLIIVVLIAYLIGRRRSRRGYESV